MLGPVAASLFFVLGKLLATLEIALPPLFKPVVVKDTASLPAVTGVTVTPFPLITVVSPASFLNVALFKFVNSGFKEYVNLDVTRAPVLRFGLSGSSYTGLDPSCWCNTRLSPTRNFTSSLRRTLSTCPVAVPLFTRSVVLPSSE